MAITRRMTLEEFEALPEEKPALELIDGVVIQKVSPQELHGLVQGWMTTPLTPFARPRRLARVIPELRTRYRADSLVPDIAVYRWARLPRDAQGRPRNDGRVVPDVAIEIRSPGQALSQQQDKCR